LTERAAYGKRDWPGPQRAPDLELLLRPKDVSVRDNVSAPVEHHSRTIRTTGVDLDNEGKVVVIVDS
jgi:hypothetical protein